jgi:hypothetical protein
MCSKEVELLALFAEEAGIPVPEKENYDTYLFAHWTVYCIVQPPVECWEEAVANAKAIANIPKDRLIDMKWEEFEEALVGI